MNVDYINPFITSTIKVLETMGGVAPKPQKPYLKKGNRALGDVSGVIGLAGEGVRGFFVVSFSRDCILNIVSRMLMEDFPEVDGEVKDAVGEITNMISGGAKAQLSMKGFFFDVAIPSIISGKNHSIEQMTNIPVIVVPFETEQGTFFIEASLYLGPLPEEELSEVPPGMVSVVEFSKKTGVRTATIRRWLTTGFLKGEKVNSKVWYIPQEELKKILSAR